MGTTEIKLYFRVLFSIDNKIPLKKFNNFSQTNRSMDQVKIISQSLIWCKRKINITTYVQKLDRLKRWQVVVKMVEYLFWWLRGVCQCGMDGSRYWWNIVNVMIIFCMGNEFKSKYITNNLAHNFYESDTRYLISKTIMYFK